MERLLQSREVARLLGVPPSRLARWRRERRGPPFVRLGPHPRYPLDGLRRWIELRLVEEADKDEVAHGGEAGGERAQRVPATEAKNDAADHHQRGSQAGCARTDASGESGTRNRGA